MAPDDAAQKKRNRLPFKPPRQQSSTATGGVSKTTKPKSTSRKSTSSTTTPGPSASRRKSTATSAKKSKATVESEDDNDDDDDGSSEDGSGSGSVNGERSQSQEPDYILAEIVTNEKSRDIESGEPAIPPKLLTKLLHHHFQNPKTKIAKDANEVVAKYIDIFVREALARAAYERTEGNKDTGDGRPSIMDGFLEVEDLEKLAPQMILDF
ncbi:uncharacterized protein TRUGW13939_08919 [Talaromyces rugulosus]|uniref:CENP-S associating centromere protein X domain-containing protein n=1 Tax=Talaromyces rugulosus TaxID=121627 RepID=A0A7H8RB63_TALRU|nr:uncharacterized protein TRUGW13939_08919 [Talaromyces rugulosus]QKX61763.1 hypothetical protein TRUGW13939_08919 [Talaromyces rugulosus]